MKGKYWSIKDHLYVEENYLSMTDTEMSKVLGRSKSAIGQYRRKRGWRKPERSALGTFKKGSKPWNKGIKFDVGGRSAETRFKKGHSQTPTFPIRTIRTRNDHGQKVKMIKTGSGWERLHRWNWIEAFGEIPDGYVVRVNGPFSEVQPGKLGNLQLVSRSENARLNANPKKQSETMRKIIYKEKTRKKYGLPLQTGYGKRLKA